MASYAPGPPYDTLGVAFIGNIMAAILYGIGLMQTCIYIKSSKDRSWLRWTVYLLCILDTLHLALITCAIYTCAVTDYANPLSLTTPTWSLKAHTVVTGLLDVIVRSLFCHRMWNLSQKNRLLTFTIESCALVAFAGSLLFSIKCFTVIGDVFRLSQLSWIMYGSLGAGVVTDILIALSLCIVLRRCRNKNPDTDSLVRMLITYGINSGALTSLCEIACLVSYATMQNNLVFIAIFFILPKLLLNSLLATLNARPELRKKYASTTASRQSVKPSLPPSPSFRFSHRTFQGSIYTKEVMDIDFRKQCAAGIILPPATPKLGRVVSYQISRAELDRTVPLND